MYNLQAELGSNKNQAKLNLGLLWKLRHSVEITPPAQFGGYDVEKSLT